MIMTRIIHGFLLVFVSVGVFFADVSIASAYISPVIRNVVISPKINNQPAVVTFDVNTWNVQSQCAASYWTQYNVDGHGWIFGKFLLSGASNTWYNTQLNLGILSAGSHSIALMIASSSVTASGGTCISVLTLSPITFSIANHNIPPTNGACSVPASHYWCSYGSPINGKSIPFGKNPLYTWTCQGVNGGTDKTCVEIGSAGVINGVCSSSGYACTSGASGNFGYSNGIYTWSCYGSNGGSNTSCSKSPTPPVVDSVTINSNIFNPVIVDGSTQYTITSTATDLSAADGITDELVRINYQGVNAGMHRGYFGWSKDSEFPFFAGTYKSDPIACTGGGSAVIYGDGYGLEHLNLISCSTNLLFFNPNQRIVYFTTTFNPSFTTPLADNMLSGYAYNKSTLLNSGWVSSRTFKISIPSPIPIVDLKLDGQDVPVPVTKNTSHTFTWTSTNATSCTASSSDSSWVGAGKPLVNAIGDTIPLSNDSTTYTLTCTGPGGTASDTVSVSLIKTLKMCPSSCVSGGTPYDTLPSFPADAPVTLYACYGTGNCSLGDLPINGTWTETNAPDNAVSLSTGLGLSVDVTQSSLGDASEQFRLSYPSGVPVPTQVTATAAVSCAALTCSSLSIVSQRESYCPSVSNTFDDNCGGMTAACDGMRNCDFNWKEIAP
ncbi:MAG: hypothetical protein KA034_00145 [Candidatus Moranbacteria bacterium]|nr:hypothetical protein [Candidatus Moranbacteria bacterium]